MNIFEKVKKFFYRRKLLKNNFFEGVTFYRKDRKIKKVILTWVYYLQKWQDIAIEKFSYLLEKKGGIVFPIRITWFYNGTFNINMTIVDANSNKYEIVLYKFLNAPRSKTMTTYDIEEYTQNNRIIYECKIQKDSIILKRKCILPVKDDGTNEKYDVEIEYNGITTVTLENYNNHQKISISYNQQLNRFEKEICEYLFSLVSEKPINNVFTNFVDIVQIFKSNNVTEEYLLAIKSTKGDETLSEITMTKNVVTMYSYTEESEFEKCFHKLTFQENVEEFILKSKK